MRRFASPPETPSLIVGAHVQFGEDVEIGGHVVIYDGVTIGDGCMIEDGVVLGKPPRLGLHSRAARAAPPEPLVIEAGATICCHAVICQGAHVGTGAVIGDHVFLRERATIGPEAVVGQGSAIGQGVRIGRRVRLQNKVIVAPGSVLEDDVFFGPLVVAANDPTIGRREATGAALEGVIARRGCRVGAGAILMPGIELGVEAVVAAGAVVTRSVPARTVVIGAPARAVRPVDPRELLDAPRHP